MLYLTIHPTNTPTLLLRMWDQDSESGHGCDELTILPVVVEPLYTRQPLRPCDQPWDATPGDVIVTEGLRVISYINYYFDNSDTGFVNSSEC